MFESSTKLAQEVVRDLQGYLDQGRQSTLPWNKAAVFQTRIRRNIKLAECPSFGQSIFTYAPSCNGAEDYAALADEVLGANVVMTRVAIDDRGGRESSTLSSLCVERNERRSASRTNPSLALRRRRR